MLNSYIELRFKGKSHEKLGHPDKATAIHENLIAKGKELSEGDSDNISIGVAQASHGSNKPLSYAYYLEALGNLGLKNADKAQQLLKASIDTYKNNLWANVMMKKQF